MSVVFSGNSLNPFRSSADAPHLDASGDRLRFDAHAVSRPLRTFTGDFYHLSQLTDGGLFFALGDVAGKGLDAAIFMAMFQEAIDDYLATRREDWSVGCLVEFVHELLGPELPSNKFATLVVGSICPGGTLRLVNAGHTPPILRRRDGSIEEVGSSGPVVGLLADSCWRSVESRFEPGDTMVLYSDGVSESVSADDDEFGVDGLRAVVDAEGSSDVEGLASAILGKAEMFRGGAPATDDVTLLVVRRA